jgi:hypothetical protein
MISDRKLAANRANGRKSRGPKTPAGKARSRRNSFVHGLSAKVLREDHSWVIEETAKAICAGHSSPAILAEARTIAE